VTHFYKGPSCRLSTEVKNEIASKCDHRAEEDLRNWREEVTIGTNFQLGLKDGIILCKLMNKLHGIILGELINKLRWHHPPQLEIIGNFIKAIQAYGMKPHDMFEANDLFENGDMTQVQTTLVAPAGLTKTLTLTLDPTGYSVIGLQPAYGTRRHLYDPKMQTDKPFDQTMISLQMGTDKGASQAGILAPGARRDIYNQKLTLQPVGNFTISLQLGTNKIASQKGMSVYGLGWQVYNPKYCAAPTEPVIHNGSQGIGTSGSEISDSDYQGEYPDDDPREYQYDDHQGIDY
uniref:Calponin-homology (CH) domain-containing protein n=1 Tax=Nannospalax galili TaxID=1026970 RepID=A0A8C6RJP0_NANGA